MNQLVDALGQLAREAGEALEERDFLTLHEKIKEVHEASEEASGPELDVLTVAESFLRGFARVEFGKEEIALRRFVREFPEFREILAKLASGELVSHDSVVGGDVLIEDGVLINTGRAYQLSRSLHSLARDLSSPAPLRSWYRVEDALGEIKDPLGEDAIDQFARKVAITKDEARHFFVQRVYHKALQSLLSQALKDYHLYYGHLSEFGKETLVECENFGQKALNCVRQGKFHEAMTYTNYAVAAEGDFCGWVDRRAYGAAAEYMRTLNKKMLPQTSKRLHGSNRSNRR